MIKKVKIGIIQSKISDNFKKNLISAIKSIKKAASKKAKIICMPELFLSNYFCQTESHSNFKLAEKIPGKTTKIFCELAKELQIVLMISLFEKKRTASIIILVSLLVKKVKFYLNIEKCIYRMILVIMRNFISLPVI